ncbi:hypothetical protein L1887_61378 [Cichorium endivia]|nr:hypothetical protein L1887_61378 [Cichorium endivia]
MGGCESGSINGAISIPVVVSIPYQCAVSAVSDPLNLSIRTEAKKSNQCSFRAQPKDPILAAAGALDGTGRQFMNEWRVFYLLEYLSCEGSFFLEFLA